MNTVGLPGEQLDMEKMPGHWALARLGKRVLRPGGLAMTRRLLSSLAIASSDHVIEFAPGLGVTARMTLKADPASYTAVERDKQAAALVERSLSWPAGRCVVGNAAETGLGDGTATVVYGEAMLTMQTLDQKRRIVDEASRLLASGGRYGIHEICLVPNDLEPGVIQQIEEDLGRAIRAGVRPLFLREWRELFESAGLRVDKEATSGFELLEPRRVIADEGLCGAMRIAFNILRDPAARRRVLTMRRVIRRYADHMRAIMLIGVKQ